MENAVSTASLGDRRKRGGDGTKDPPSSKSNADGSSSSEPPAAAPGLFSLLADLPSGAIQNLLDLQNHQERASLRLTCRGMRQEVEIFCKYSMVRLKMKHQVDNAFDDRIRDQTDLETSRNKPVILPFFYLLWKAMKTHLYTLASPERNGLDSICYNLRLSESEDRIVVTSGEVLDRKVQLWDLNSKQLLRVIGARNSYDQILIGDSVVICPDGEETDDGGYDEDSHTIRVHSQGDGSLLNEYHIPNAEDYRANRLYLNWISRGDKILFFTMSITQIHAFDARNGMFRMNLLTEEKDDEYSTTDAVVTECGGLVVTTFPCLMNPRVPPEIHVLDLDDYSTRCVFRGEQYRWASPEYDSSLEPYPLRGSKKVLFFRRESNPEVLDVTDGTLSRDHPYSFPEKPKSIVPVSPQQFLAINDSRQTTTIYNAETGVKERLLDHAQDTTASLCVVSKSRQEVFLGLNDGPTIAAYCLTEP